jgi:GNAT superfamily N-acetyltransferase
VESEMMLQSFFRHEFGNDLLSRLERINRGYFYLTNIFDPKNGVVEVVIAKDDEEGYIDVGFSLILEGSNNIVIHLLYVIESYRMRGIGRSMVDHCIDEYEGDIDVVSMKSSIDFWKKMGFSIVAEGKDGIDMTRSDG